MKSSEVPFLSTPTPEDGPKPARRSGASAVKPAPTSQSLAPASESSDAGIQMLVARRDTAQSAGDTAGTETVTAQLAALGYR